MANRSSSGSSEGRVRTVLLAGATGLVGRELLHELATRPQVRRLHVLLRRPVPLPPAVDALTVDFAALPALPPACDAYCALGTTMAMAGSREAFRAVDLQAVLDFARAAQAAGARRLAVVSALGANARSRTFYNRVKGEMEQGLQALGFETLVIARPSLLVGDRRALGQSPRLAERLALATTLPIAPLIPRAWRPIGAAIVARAMVQAMLDASTGVQVLESFQMLSQAAAPRA